MPRDFASALAKDKESTMESMPRLNRENAPDSLPPEITTSPEAQHDDDDMNGGAGGSLFGQIAAQRNDKRDELHPYTQTLTLNDIESCVRLEEATFPENERCSREKFEYRLKRCGELSLGIFTSIDKSEAEPPKTPTADTSAPVYSGAPDRKSVLLGHIVATKTTNDTVTDDDMAVPTSDPQDPKLGHKEAGRTICIHSLAVLPKYQGKGLGKTLMKAYLQRMESHGVADRTALIAHEELIPYYESFGYVNKGKSEVKFGGGGWFDMVKELKSEKELEADSTEFE